MDQARLWVVVIAATGMLAAVGCSDEPNGSRNGGSGNGADAVPKEAAERGYVNRPKQFALTPPEGWVAAENLQGSVVAFLAPEPVDGVRPNVNVVIVPATAKDIEALKEANMAQLPQINGFKAIEQGVIDHPSGRKAFMVVYEHSMLATPIRAWYTAFLVDGREYGLTITVAASAAERYADEARRVMDSFIAW